MSTGRKHFRKTPVVVWGVGVLACVCAQEEAKSQLQASSSIAVHIILLRQDLPLSIELIILARLPGQ